MFNLTGLDRFKDKNKIPSNLSFIYYILLEKGLSLKEIMDLPCPFLFSILHTYQYLKEQEEETYKKRK